MNKFAKTYMTWDDVPVLITLDQAAILLNMNREVIRRNCENKIFPATKIGKTWRIDKQKLKEMFGY